jgi:hypothetical protein
MLKYLKPKIIPITFILFFLGNIITFLIVWGIVGFLAFEFASVQIARILMFAGIIPAFGAAKIFYSSVLPLWIIFSISKTENLHFLKYFLVQSKIVSKKIIENNESIEKIAINSSGVEFADDRTVESETIIKKSNAGLAGILLTTLIISLLLFQSNPENRIFTIVILIIGLLIGLREIVKLKNQTFTFKLSNNGVWLSEAVLIKWDKIKSNKINKDFQSDFIKRVNRHWYFTFNYIDLDKRNKEFSVEINQLNINDGRLNYLIYVYKNRYKKLEKTTASNL